MLLHCLKLLLLLSCIFLSTQCSKVTEIPMPISLPIKNAHPIVSPYTKPASNYLAFASHQVGEEKQSQLILAAGRLINEGSWQEAETILAQMDDFYSIPAAERHILFAKIDLIREQPTHAIRHLSNVREIHDLPLYYQIQFHKNLAAAYQSIGNNTDSINERIKLDKLFPDATAKTSNRRAIWLTLTAMPIPELESLALEHNKKELAGWLQLALIARKPSNTDAQSILSQIEQWQLQYPQHSGNDIIDTTPNLFAKPKKIAVLLPLSGPLAAPGIAIRDGFQAGYRTDNAAGHVKIHYYNTNAKDVAALYQKAITDGANIVIGPLSKTDVTKVALLEHPVPTILLNDTNTQLNDFAYQFGLSPSNEAKAVAVKARQHGHTQALIIAPAGRWGDEVVAAFSEQWQKSHGHVVDAFRYYPKANLAKDIRQFLQVSESEMRGKQLKQLLGSQIEVTTNRRQDFDVIFLLAYPSIARQIMPLLKYYYAQDVPVYSTSAVYSANINSAKDRDLDGIIFCDMPWVFTHQLSNRNWPEQFNSYNRLYALGLDSYALTKQLNQLILFPAVGINDKSGILFLNSTQQIVRISAWGQFKHGFPTQRGDLIDGRA